MFCLVFNIYICTTLTKIKSIDKMDSLFKYVFLFGVKRIELITWGSLSPSPHQTPCTQMSKFSFSEGLRLCILIRGALTSEKGSSLGPAWWALVVGSNRHICGLPADGTVTTETSFIILTAAIPRFCSWLVSVIHQVKVDINVEKLGRTFKEEPLHWVLVGCQILTQPLFRNRSFYLCSFSLYRRIQFL